MVHQQEEQEAAPYTLTHQTIPENEIREEQVVPLDYRANLSAKLIDKPKESAQADNILPILEED